MDYDDEKDGEDGNGFENDDYGGEFGMGGNDEDPDDTDQQDEAVLLASLEYPKSEHKTNLEEVVRSIGQSTVAMIINTKKESGSDHFSTAEKEALLKVFQ
jgi:hypothetical protein